MKVTSLDYKILAALARGSQTGKALITELHIFPHSSVYIYLKRLLEKGYVERLSRIRNTDYFKWRATESGRAVLLCIERQIKNINVYRLFPTKGFDYLFEKYSMDKTAIRYVLADSPLKARELAGEHVGCKEAFFDETVECNIVTEYPRVLI